VAALGVNDADKRRLADAIRAIEAKSRAEIVLAVRARSGSYERGPALAAGVVCSATLCFLLFSPWEFSLVTIAVAPIAAAALTALAASSVPSLLRILSRRTVRQRSVESAARATFVERGVSRTRERTGVLIYVSWLEREVCVVPDKGVADVIPPDAWMNALAALKQGVASGAGASAIAAALAPLGVLLARELPVREDDVDELPDTVEAAS
jgi:putative membrane protein